MTIALNTISRTTLISPYYLVNAIQLIESRCAGWWWSISQKSAETCITMGPGRNCPRAEDIAFAMTREGDQGSSASVIRSEEDQNSIENHLSDDRFDKVLGTLINSFSTARNLKPGHVPSMSVAPTYRHQDRRALEVLSETYSRFIVWALPLFKAHRYSVEELYLGSCDLSVDCSLRGKRGDGTEFDITIDLQGGAALWESLSHSIDELKSDILTQGSGVVVTV